MNSNNETTYRLKLAEGFLAEAEQDFKLARWRSCVNHAQLAVENSGKAVLSLFGISPKTHDPAREMATLLRKSRVPQKIQELAEKLLPELLALGSAEHFLTDYGDESAMILPWDLFTRISAEEAIQAARRSLTLSRQIVNLWMDATA